MNGNRPSTREAVIIVPIVDEHLILIRGYAVGTESYDGLLEKD